MPKVNNNLLAEVTNKTVGYMNYVASRDRQKQIALQKLFGITKGQWKRFKYSCKGGYIITRGLRTSQEVIDKLELAKKHADSPHLFTLLKVLEARHED